MRPIAEIGKYRKIIFDFDGVIADTDTYRYQLLKEVLEKHHIHLDGNEDDLIGITTQKFLSDHFGHLDKATMADIINERRSLFFKHIARYSHLFPGAKDTLIKLKQSGYSLFLATSNDQEMITRLLSHHRIDGIFQSVFPKEITEDARTMKKSYKNVLAQMKASGEDCLVIEDSSTGVMAAKEAGLFCVGFNRNDDPNVIENADIVLGTYAELRRLFGIG